MQLTNQGTKEIYARIIKETSIREDSKRRQFNGGTEGRIQAPKTLTFH
jgi:hypothetical protein